MNGSGDMTAAFSAALESAEATPAAESSPDSTPALDTTTQAPQGEATAAATAQPETATTEPVTATAEEQPKGEPPAWRWQDILKNAREESAKEATARAKQEIEQQYSGLKDFSHFSADERAGLLVWNRALRGDPEALAQVERVNPALAAALSGKAQAIQPTEPEQEPEPDAAIQMADGSTVPVFTSEGMKRREAWLQKQLESSFAEKFKPVLTTADKLQRQEEAEARQQQSMRWAQQVLNPIKRLPYFEEFKPGIQKALAELPTEFSGNLEDVVVDVYAKLHTAKLDQLTQQGNSKAVAELQQRAVAGTTNPNTASTGSPKKFQPGVEGFKDALAHFGSDAR
jgi:hypothetical protein